LSIPSRVAISFKDFASPDSSIASQRWPLVNASLMDVGATSHGLTGAFSPFDVLLSRFVREIVIGAVLGCQRPPYRSHFKIGIKEPIRDRHNGAI
jgi:hypothetical protein